jgi:hypothetical protein
MMLQQGRQEEEKEPRAVPHPLPIFKSKEEVSISASNREIPFNSKRNQSKDKNNRVQRKKSVSCERRKGEARETPSALAATDTVLSEARMQETVSE